MIAQYLGFDSDYIIIGLAALVVILMILMIVNVVQMSKLKKNYKIFMTGKNAKTLEDTLIKRLDQVDELMVASKANEKNSRHFPEHAAHISENGTCKIRCVS